MMNFKRTRKLNRSDANNSLGRRESRKSALNNGASGAKLPLKETRKVTETMKLLETSCKLNFNELINMNAEGLLKKQGKEGQSESLFERLSVKEKVNLLVRVYKDVLSNLNFAFEKKKLEAILDDREDPFWAGFRAKRVKSEQVKNMEYNNILKYEKIEALDLQIERKKQLLREKKEEKFSEYMKLCEARRELKKNFETKKKELKILEEDKGRVKLGILEDFFGGSANSRQKRQNDRQVGAEQAGAGAAAEQPGAAEGAAAAGGPRGHGRRAADIAQSGRNVQGLLRKRGEEAERAGAGDPGRFERADRRLQQPIERVGVAKGDSEPHVGKAVFLLLVAERARGKRGSAFEEFELAAGHFDGGAEGDFGVKVGERTD